MKKPMEKKKSIPIIFLIPIVIAISIVPLLVYMKLLPVEEHISKFWMNEKEHVDFFSYFKSIWIIILGVLSLVSTTICIFLSRVKFKKTHIYTLVGIYAILIILSTMLAEYKKVALFGFLDRSEGMLVLLAYLALFFTTMNLVNEKRHVKVLMGSLFISALIVGLIGIFQYFGYDIFRTALGKSLIFSEQFRSSADSLEFKFGEGTRYKNIIFSTLFNPNNAGCYMTMLSTLSFLLFLFIRKRSHKIAFGAFSCLMFANLIGTDSRGAYLGSAISIFVTMLLFRKIILRNWKSIVTMSGCFIIILVGLNYVSSGSFSTRAKLISPTYEVEVQSDRISHKISDFKIDNGELNLMTNIFSIKARIKNKKLSFVDENNKEIVMHIIEPGKKFTFKDKKYNECIVSFNGNIMHVQMGNSYLNFRIENNSFVFANSRGEEVEIKNVDSFGFNGMERLGSSRGYIWSRTIPLLKNTLLLGHGPDTFAMYFPQDDFLGKLKYMGDANILVDKPHNMYLQTAVNTGLLSLITLLAIFLDYLKTSISLFIKQKDDNFWVTIGIALFASTLGYMLSGLFTDSVVSVAPVFWILLGLGIGINCTIKQNQKSILK